MIPHPPLAALVALICDDRTELLRAAAACNLAGRSQLLRIATRWDMDADFVERMLQTLAPSSGGGPGGGRSGGATRPSAAAASPAAMRRARALARPQSVPALPSLKLTQSRRTTPVVRSTVSLRVPRDDLWVSGEQAM